MYRPFLSTYAFAGLALLQHLTANAALEDDEALVDFSLEQLSEIVVTSVSRQETRLSQAAASIYLISATDIRRSGATSLPEVLRLAPTLQVARSAAQTYAITARGFSSTLENKLLVLIDGRSVYSPLFSGVFWDMQDVMIEDIERIEVISGPGATIWGANAVNGVINIITRSSRETQGGLLAVNGGEHGRSAALRHGGQLAGGVSYRVYGKSVLVGDTANEAGTGLRTGGHRSQAGFRLDRDREGGALVVSGDVYQGELGQMRTDPLRIAGANLTGRYNARLSAAAEVRLQVYLDHTERDQAGVGAQRLDTLDLEAQHGLRLGTRHSLAWGGGYRYSWDRVTNGRMLQFTPAARDLHWANLFAQDEVIVAPDLRLTAGVKVEHNRYTGLETLPGLRLAWSPGANRLVWGAASRTVRAPSRIDRDLKVARLDPAGAAGPYMVEGGPDFVSESAHVLELGYRAQTRGGFAYSMTAFYSDYDKLRTLEPRPGQGAVFLNLGQGIARGVELSGSWQPLRSWRLSGGAVLQNIRTGLKAGSMDASGQSGLATNDPACYWTLRSSHDLARNVQADVSLRHVGALPAPAVPAYHELDARLAWQARPDLELALVGHNLLHSSHSEFGAPGTRQVFERTLSVSASLRF